MRPDSLGDTMIDVVCKGQKQAYFQRPQRCPVKDIPTFKYAEPVSWSHLKWFASVTSIWYEDKTTAGVLALQLGDTLRSCTFISSRARNFKLYIKLVLCCQITRWCNKCRNEAPKMSSSWPKVRKKTAKIVTRKRQQDHKEVSFQMTIFLFDSVLKKNRKETLILVYV